MMAEVDNQEESAQGVSRILVADDDPLSLRVLQKALERWGHEVAVARDGTEAWQILTRPEAPRMAILDWMMPGMDGPTICQRARAAPAITATYLDRKSVV